MNLMLIQRIETLRKFRDEGFFDEPRTINNTLDKFASRGTQLHREAVRRALEEATTAGILAYVGTAMCNEWVRSDLADTADSHGKRMREGMSALIHSNVEPALLKSLAASASVARLGGFTVREFLDVATKAYLEACVITEIVLVDGSTPK